MSVTCLLSVSWSWNMYQSGTSFRNGDSHHIQFGNLFLPTVYKHSSRLMTISLRQFFRACSGQAERCFSHQLPCDSISFPSKVPIEWPLVMHSQHVEEVEWSGVSVVRTLAVERGRHYFGVPHSHFFSPFLAFLQHRVAIYSPCKVFLCWAFTYVRVCMYVCACVCACLCVYRVREPNFPLSDSALSWVLRQLCVCVCVWVGVCVCVCDTPGCTHRVPLESSPAHPHWGREKYWNSYTNGPCMKTVVYIFDETRFVASCKLCFVTRVGVIFQGGSHSLCVFFRCMISSFECVTTMPSVLVWNFVILFQTQRAAWVSVTWIWPCRRRSEQVCVTWWGTSRCTGTPTERCSARPAPGTPRASSTSSEQEPMWTARSPSMEIPCWWWLSTTQVQNV